MAKHFKDSIPDILSEKHDVYCPYIGEKPLKLLCYYTLLQLYRGRKKAYVDQNVAKKITTKKLKKYEYCFNCDAFPGYIWKDKELCKSLPHILSGIFGGKVARAKVPPVTNRLRAKKWRAKQDPERMRRLDRESQRKYRDKHREKYNKYQREYMRKRRA